MKYESYSATEKPETIEPKELTEKEKLINRKQSVVEYLKSNHPGTTEAFCEIIYTFGFIPSETQDIIDVACVHYELPKSEAQRIYFEYTNFYQAKKTYEKRESEELELAEKHTRFKEEIQSLSFVPGKLTDEILESISDKISELSGKKSPLPKIQNFLDCEPVKIETVLKIGFIEIPKGITCCIHAPGGTGKSVLLQRAVMASGVRAVFISGEDSSGRMANMLEPYKKFYSNNNSDFAHFDNQNIDGIIDFIGSSDYSLYIIDPLSSFCTGDKWGTVETENGVAAELLRNFNGITAKTGKTIIYTHHESKSATDMRTAARGSSALVDNARMGISIHRLSEEMRVHSSTKKNRFQLQSAHNNNVSAFQSYLTRELGKTKEPVFRAQNVVGIIVMTCHKNNYGPVGDTASYILTAHISSQGLNVVPAEGYYPIVSDAIMECFHRGEM